VLISSSFISTAAWNTDQLNKVNDLATQHAGLPAPAQNRPAAPHETAANMARPAVSSKAHNDHTSELQDHKGTPRAESRPESQREHGRRAHRKTSGSTQPSDSESPKPASTVLQAGEVEAPHFLEILSNILPQDSQSSQEHTDQESSSVRPQIPSNPIAPGTSGLPNSSIQLAGVAVQEKLGTAKATSQLTAETASVESIATPTKSDLTVPQDSSVEITKQLTSSDMKPVLDEKAGEHGEMAFAVRLSERTTLNSALNLNDVQSAIAASRFDASDAGGRSGNRDQSEPRTPQSIQQVGETKSTTDATAEQAATPGWTSVDASAPQITGAQILPGRAGASDHTRPESTIGPSTPAATSTSAGAAQQLGAGMTPGALLASSTEPGNTGGVKSTSEARVPQFIESKDENAGQTSASVHDISLKLTSKDQAPVQVRLSERAGELHVSVRTPDTGLTRGLRDGLSDLIGHLEHNGYRAESWQPAGSGSSSAQDQAHDSPSQNKSSQQQNSGGSGSGNRQQQNARDHQEPETQTPKWVGELESSLQRNLRSWPPSATR
jgi:hypothetical protein